METIHLLEYKRAGDTMYSYYTREYCGIKKFCLCIGSKFQDEEIHNDIYELSKGDIITILNQHVVQCRI